MMRKYLENRLGIMIDTGADNFERRLVHSFLSINDNLLMNILVKKGLVL